MPLKITALTTNKKIDGKYRSNIYLSKKKLNFYILFNSYWYIFLKVKRFFAQNKVSNRRGARTSSGPNLSAFVCRDALSHLS